MVQCMCIYTCAISVNTVVINCCSPAPTFVYYTSKLSELKGGNIGIAVAYPGGVLGCSSTPLSRRVAEEVGANDCRASVTVNG